MPASERIPISRLIKKLEAKCNADPKQAEGQYALARMHYLAFATRAVDLDVYPPDMDPDGVLPEVFVRAADGKLKWDTPDFLVHGADGEAKLNKGREAARTIAARNYHAENAVRGFEEAIQLDPENPFYWLGYASVLEDIWAWVFAKDSKFFPEEFLKIKVPALREAYGKAFELGKKKDVLVSTRYVGREGEFVSYEAARALLRLEKASTVPFTKDEAQQLQEARQTITRFENMPVVRGVISPIVFSFRKDVERLNELLASETSVDFDLRGYGWKERWPWVKPELGFLVWDPEKTGRITSARQLFGTFTFRLFWKDGYQALDVLDDDGDGRLEGVELDGISAWFDRNSDGKSDAGEVTPLGEIGVVSVATHASGKDGIHLVADRGITTRDGKILRSWDWMVEPLPRRRLSE